MHSCLGDPENQQDVTQDHLFAVRGRKLAIDPLKCRVVGIEPAAAAPPEGPGRNEGSPSPVMPKADSPRRTNRSSTAGLRSNFLQAYEELNRLRAAGLPPDLPRPKARRVSEWRADLTLTHRCNLACRYCFAPLRDGRRPEHEDMPPRIAQQAVDFLLSSFGDISAPLTLRFGNTGETLLSLDRQAEIREYALLQAKKYDRRIRFHWGNTNLTLAQDPEMFARVYASPQLPHLGISLDGPQPVHDSVRVFPDGQGSHAIVEEIARRLLQAKSPPHVHCTFSGLNPDLLSIFQYLYGLGFRDIRLRPVRAAPASPLGYNPAAVEALKKGFSDLVAFFADQSDEDLLLYLRAINPKGDMLLRFVYRLANGNTLLHRCPAGQEYVCIDTNGDIYPCAYFISSRSMQMGSIFSGLDPDAVALYREGLRVDRKESCAACWARFLCGGGCYYQAFLSNGEVARPDENKCELVRHICEQAAYLLSCIHERPAVRDALFMRQYQGSKSPAQQEPTPAASL